MNTALAHKVLEATTKFVNKQASSAEVLLMRDMSKLFDKALADLLRDVKATGAMGRTSIAAAERRLNSLKNPLANTILGSSSKLLSPENRRAAQALNDRAFTASQRTLDRMIGNVTENLRTSFVDGLGINEAARSLGNEFKRMEDSELRRIARTETHTAQMNEKFLANVANDLVQYHQWISAEDGRTRDGTYGTADHVEMNGQIVEVGKPFSNGLLYPGDMGGDIEEWINCRCRLVPFIMPPGKMAPPDMDFFYEEDLENATVGVELVATPESPYVNINEMMRDILNNQKDLSNDEIIQTAQRFFPDTKFSKSHLSWYKSQFKTGKLKPWEGPTKFPTGTPPEPEKAYGTIADLMRDVLFSDKFKGLSDDEVISLVKNRFPNSKYNINHLRWYKNQAKKGKFNPAGTTAITKKPIPPSKPKPVTRPTAPVYEVTQNDYARKTVLVEHMTKRMKVLRGSVVKRYDQSFQAAENTLKSLPSGNLDKISSVTIRFAEEGRRGSVGGDYSLALKRINIYNNTVFTGTKGVEEVVIHELAHAIDHKFHGGFGFSLTGTGGSGNTTVAAGRKIIHEAFERQQTNVLKRTLETKERLWDKLTTARAKFSGAFHGGFGENWKDVPTIRTKGSIISRYATRDPQEFFAESVVDYYRGGENVKALSEDLYNFIKDVVFAGKEFPVSIKRTGG